MHMRDRRILLGVPMTYCSLCEEPLPAVLHQGEIADKYIYKMDELAYIELAHIECAKRADDKSAWRTD